MWPNNGFPEAVWKFGSLKTLGIETECKLEQFENAESPIDVTLDGIAIDGNLEHPENAELPIDVTLVGIVMDCKFSQ